MARSPESTGHLHLTTAGELYVDALVRQHAAEDAEWDDPSPENTRRVQFWTGQALEYGAMQASTIIPLF